MSDTDSQNIIEVDTTLNSSFPFAVSGEPSSYDVQSVALHEFGHWLELLHSLNPGDVMYRRIDPGDLKRFLSTDDISGIQYLYPMSGAPPGGGGGGNEICYRASRCGTICYEQPTMEVYGLYKPMIESLNVQQLESLVFQRPRRRALLFAILNDLPELQHIGLNNEEEVSAAWEPIAQEWLPGLRWLSGDTVDGENMQLTEQRADDLLVALGVIEKHASRSLRRDIAGVKQYVRDRTGMRLEAMRSELFLDYRQPPASHRPVR